MLKVYSKNTMSFSNNGLGILKDYITNPIITEALNGEYTLEFEYSKKGVFAEEIKEENLVKVNGQVFRIVLVTKDLKIIKVLAKHIVFDLNKNFLIDVAPTNQNGAGALQWILDRTQYANNFTSTSDVDIIKSARYVRKNVFEALISAENSITNVWGGELEFDNYEIKLHAQRGKNRGLVIRYGKNLNGVEYQLDFSTVVTRIMPQGKDGLLLPEQFIDSPLISNYANPIIRKIEFDIGIDDETTEEQAYTKLRESVAELYADNIDKPQISVKVDFIELSKVTEYAKYSNLELAYLGDTIKFIIPDLNLNFEIRIVKTTYDCTKERFINFELGTIVPNFVNQNTSKLNDLKKVVEKIDASTILQEAKDNATFQITSALGGYVYKTKNELFIMDTDNTATAEKIWRWNLNGLGYSSTGINGPYGLAMTQDGKIVADFITTGNLDASLINVSNLNASSIYGGVLTVGGLNNVAGAIDVKDANNNKVVSLNKDGVILSNGAKLIGGNGVLSTFIFTNDFDKIGWHGIGGMITRFDTVLNLEIPPDIVVTSAILHVHVVSRYVTGIQYVTNGFYTATNIRLYTLSGTPELYYNYPEYSEPNIVSGGGVLNSSFGTYNPTAGNTIQVKTHDITNLIPSNNMLTLKLSGGANTYSDFKEFYDGGFAKMELVITGYKK